MKGRTSGGRSHDTTVTIPVSPQMFGSGKSCLGKLFRTGLEIHSDFIRDAAGKEGIGMDLVDRLLGCVVVSIDLQANVYRVPALSRDDTFGELLARALYPSVPTVNRFKFEQALTSCCTVDEVLDEFAKYVDRAVFVHVDEIGVVEDIGARPHGMTDIEALRHLRSRLIQIAENTHVHAVYATGNTPLLLVLGRTEKSSPCGTRVVLIDALSTSDVGRMLEHDGCPDDCVATYATAVVSATAGIARLVRLSIQVLQEREWSSPIIRLSDFVSRGEGMWKPPTASPMLKQVLRCAAFELDFFPDETLPADVRELLGETFDSAISGVPPSVKLSILEVIRACNLFVAEQPPKSDGICSSRWRIVWPRVLLEHWIGLTSIGDLAVLYRSLLSGLQGVSVRKGDMLESVVLRVVRARLTTAEVGMRLGEVFPFTEGSAVADVPIDLEDRRGLVEYMPKMVSGDSSRLDRTSWKDGVNCFTEWKNLLASAVPDDVVSMTIAPAATAGSGAQPHDWQCNIADSAELDCVMPPCRLYVPLPESSSADLRYKSKGCILDLQMKHACSLSDNDVAAEIRKAINTRGSCPVLFALVPMKQPKVLPPGGTPVYRDAAVLAHRWEPRSTVCGVALPDTFTFVYIAEAGMMQLLNEVNYQALSSPRPTLATGLSPYKDRHHQETKYSAGVAASLE